MNSQTEPTQTSPKTFFEQQLAEAISNEAIARKRVDTLAIARLAVFAGILISIWLWNQTGQHLPAIVLVALAVLFMYLMRMQGIAKRRRDYQKNIQEISEDELDRLAFRFRRSDTGLQHSEKEHPFAADLDIFGEYSLYKLLNRTHTAEGSRRLGNWLKNHADVSEIRARQIAAAELKDNPLVIQEWQATALLHASAAGQVNAFRAWATNTLSPDFKSWLKWRWYPLVTLVLAILYFLGIASGWILTASIAIHLIIMRRFVSVIQDITSKTAALGKTLVAYAELLKLAEESPLQSPWWSQRRSLIHGSSAKLQKVGRLFERLDYRNNAYFLLFVDIPTLWDLHCLYGLENWKKEHATELSDWLGVLADIEAINSLAGYAFANPDCIAPKISPEVPGLIRTTRLGHPLIPREKRVSNNFDTQGTGQTILITGSNMSGKSTFLRTLGLNMTLAQMGAMVSADTFECAPFRVFSSMRTQDSLEESTSSFYAELKRLRRLLELAAAHDDTPVFYLLDEILKGTNSADRHRGAEALIKQLHTRNASGMVSTHDIELGEWGEGEAYVRNFHFRSDVGEGKLHFDYRLHGGICKSFNASELMRMMGIEVN